MPASQPKLLKSFPQTQQLCRVRFSPDGKLLAAGSFLGSVQLWDISDDAKELPPRKSLSGHDGWVQSIAFHPQKPWLFSADSWGRVIAWNLAEAEAKPLWNRPDVHDGWIYQIAISNDGATLVSVGRDRSIRLCDTSTGKEIARLDQHQEPVQAVAFHPDGQHFLTGDLKGVVKQWHLETRKIIREFDAKSMFLRDRIQDVGGVRCFAFDPKGETLFIGGSVPKSGGFVECFTHLLSFTWSDGKPLKEFRSPNPQDGYLHDLQWHPDGFLMGVSSGQPGQGKLLLFKVGEDKPFFSGAGMTNCHSLALHPNLRKLFVLATNANSSGNGRQIGKNKEYPGNTSPLHLWEIPTGVG
jgi:WD40 repeat protein